MPKAMITAANDLGFTPGKKPLVKIKDRDAHAEFVAKSGALSLNLVDAIALRRSAYEYVTNERGRVILVDSEGFRTNSLLIDDEWEELDSAVIEAVTVELNAVQRLRGLGLTQQLGGLGTLVSAWSVASERHEARVSLDGRAIGQRDRVEKQQRRVPVPIIHAEYEIGRRELEASRRLGDALDAQEARAAAQVVGEKVEEIVFEGESSIVFGGDGIDGVTTITGRDTDTAANYGGGDWATAGNGPKTILGMISALTALYYRGPWGVWISNTQYFQVQTPFTTRDGNDLADIVRIPGVQFAERSDWLPAGEVLLVQLTKDVIDIAVALEVTNREWSSPDDMAFFGKVMASIVPRVKTDHAGNVGIAHATAA